MRPTRILVTDMPRLQRKIVCELLRARADVELVEATARQETLREDAAAGQAQVVILGRDDPDVVRGLLEQWPRLVVLTAADRELAAWSYGLTPYRTYLGELSPATLIAGIELREPPPPWWNR